MPRTRRGSIVEHGQTTVTMASGAAAGKSVSFREVFTTVPHVFLVEHLADSGATLTASSVTKLGFTLSVSGSDLPDGDVVLEWIAHEKT